MRSRRPDRPANQHLVPGERAVTELLAAAPQRVRELWFERGRDFPELSARASELGLTIRSREREEFDDLVGPGLARGVVAIARPPKAWVIEDLLEREDPPRTRRGFRLLVALDGVQDPHNFGAVIRSAEFFGAAGVVWARDRAAPLGPVAVRSSAGATERIALCQVTNLARALEQAKAANWWVVGTVVDEGRTLAEFGEDPPTDMVVVLGSEEKGLRRLTRERCDFLVTIERAGELGSLNVSAAAAVTLAQLG